MSRTRCHSSSGLSSTVPMAPMPALDDEGVQAAELGGGPADGGAYGGVVGDVGLDGEDAGRGARGLAVEYGDPCARARSSRAATAAPMPEAPPVTRAVSPSKSVLTGHRLSSSVRAAGLPDRARRG